MTRHRSLVFGFLISVAASAWPARLIGQSHLGSERQDFLNATGDIWGVWSSPARATTEDIPPVFGAAAVITATGLRDSVVWEWLTHHQQTLAMKAIRPLRENWRLPLFEFGSGQVLLPMSAILYASGRLSHSVDLRDAGLGCAAGHLASLGAREIAYLTVSRARPRVTDDPYEISFPGAKDWSWHSFLSGHIANSMACASFIGHRFALGKAAPLPYAMSSIIGLGRMADGRHWFSDTMTGAILGFAIGKAIAARQLTRESRQLGPTPRVTTESVARTLSEPQIPVFRLSFKF